VVDALRNESLPCDLVPVTITGGEHSTRSRAGVAVPKRELIVGLQMMVARGELSIPADLAHRRTLIDELASMTRNLKAKDSRHDDLALSLALAAWRLRDRQTIGEQPHRLL
jgi:hypothetical protein